VPISRYGNLSNATLNILSKTVISIMVKIDLNVDCVDSLFVENPTNIAVLK